MKASVVAAVAVLVGLSGCASVVGSDTEKDFTFPDYKVGLLVRSAPLSCFLDNAVLQNNAKRQLGYVFTQLLVTSSSGVSVNDVDINFLPTVPGGTSSAAHVGTQVLAPGQSCESVTLSLTGSAG